MDSTDPSPPDGTMTSPTQPSTSTASHTHGSSNSNSNSNSNHLKQKRARSQLSCTACRTGKLKCNREKPACDQCIKRSRESACLYVAPPAKHKPAQNVKGRIRQLESLVVNLMNQNRTAQYSGQGKGKSSEVTAETASTERDGQHHSTGGPFSQLTPPSDTDTGPQSSTSDRSQQLVADDDTPPLDDVDAAATPFGQMMISKNEISYVGDSHWGAILNSISDLKQDLGDDDEDEGEMGEENPLRPGTDAYGQASMIQSGLPHGTTGLGFMLGNAGSVTKEQLIANVPEKRVADRLLSLWFNSPDPFKPIVHAPTFQEEYKRYWRSPKDTPVMWLGLLFAIMSLAASFGLRDNDPSSPQAQKVLADVSKYHSLAASAAVLADFTRPKEYTVECLMLYAAGLRSNNAFVNVWLMVGLIVRLALRMGYHRDPKHYPSITAFQGEMRRRTWAIMSMIDVLISFQLGLPSMVKTIQSDAQPPRNLLDRDFNAGTQVLPPSRSADELTPSSYTRAKLRIVRIFADAAELSHATVPPAYEEVMQLDRQLEEAKASIPPLLHMPEDSDLVTDPAEQLMCRFNLDLLYLKTKTVLHRRYMLTPMSRLSAQEQQMGIGISRKICIECGLRVLQHHHTIYSASQSGGQLESVKWYMGSISTHDFLLAAMIICLELSQQINDQTSHGTPDGIQCPHRRAMMEALDRSQKIWAEASRQKHRTLHLSERQEGSRGENMFDETEKAARAMAVMLEKVKKQFGARGTTPQFNGDVAMRGVVAKFRDASNTAPSDGVADGSQQEAANGTKLPFNGVVSSYDWGDMAGVPETSANGQLNFNAAPFTTNPISSSGSADPSIQSAGNYPGQWMEQLAPDYSMIGDMLDVNADLDWEMWDSQINKGQQEQASEWPSQPELHGRGAEGQDELYNLTYGNALVGGSGQVSLPVAGNATIPSGTGTVPGGTSMIPDDNGFGVASPFGSGAQFAAMDLDMSLPLEDVNFDLGLANYNRNGMYPASKADWEDFHRRKSAAPT